MELLLCCVGTDLPGSPATIRATGHRRQSADTGFTGNETRSAATERPGQTEVRGSRRGTGTTHYPTFTLLDYYRQDAHSAYVGT